MLNISLLRHQLYAAVLQPFRDAIRLFSREQYFPLVSNYLAYYFSHVFGLFLSLLVWLLIPYLRGFISFELGLLFFFWPVQNTVKHNTIQSLGHQPSSENNNITTPTRLKPQTLSSQNSWFMNIMSFCYKKVRLLETT